MSLDIPCVVWSGVASVVSAKDISDCVVCDCTASARVVCSSFVASGVTGSSDVVSVS